MVLRNVCDYDAPNTRLAKCPRMLTLENHITIRPYTWESHQVSMRLRCPRKPYQPSPMGSGRVGGSGTSWGSLTTRRASLRAISAASSSSGAKCRALRRHQSPLRRLNHAPIVTYLLPYL